MPIELKDKVVMVTGAGKGIGRSIALAFAREKARLVLASRTEKDLAAVQKEVERIGAESTFVPTDVTKESAVENLVKTALNKFGRTDILINNAGIGIYSKVVDMKLEEFDAMYDVNVKGVFLCTRAVLPHMIKQKEGVVVNIASLAGRNAFIGGAGYCATKWALIGFARSLMLEVREHNIRVITICPGSVDTTFASTVRSKSNILEPEDVAETVLAAVKLPSRAMVSEIDIRPTNPK
jgi:3-oxoacyl-[acyl-carrier protein] reductase